MEFYSKRRSQGNNPFAPANPQTFSRPADEPSPSAARPTPNLSPPGETPNLLPPRGRTLTLGRQADPKLFAPAKPSIRPLFQLP